MAVMHGLGIGNQSVGENQPAENPQQASRQFAGREKPGNNQIVKGGPRGR